MEEWVTLLLDRREAIICTECSKIIENQEVHMYVTFDNEIDEAVCEECWWKCRYGKDIRIEEK